MPLRNAAFYSPVCLRLLFIFMAESGRGGSVVSPFPVDRSLPVCPSAPVLRAPGGGRAEALIVPAVICSPVHRLSHSSAIGGEIWALPSYFAFKKVNSCSAHMAFDETFRESSGVGTAPVTGPLETPRPPTGSALCSGPGRGGS